MSGVLFLLAYLVVTFAAAYYGTMLRNRRDARSLSKLFDEVVRDAVSDELDARGLR